MSNPFDSDSDPFSPVAPQPVAASAFPPSNGHVKRGSVNANGMDAGALLAQQVAMRNGVAGGGAPVNERAARMFAASQSAAAEAESNANQQQHLTGADASAFNSRERNARYSIIQSNQGQTGAGMGMAFPMTDMVDAAAEKKIGLSFASLAVRDGPSLGHSHDFGNVASEEGMVVNEGHQGHNVGKSSIPASSSSQSTTRSTPVVPAADPWNQSPFGSSNDPFAKPAPPPSVFRNQPQQSRPQQQAAPVAAARPTTNVMDFDPLSFGDMGASSSNNKPAPAPAADPWGSAAASSGASSKKSKKAPPPPVESSSSSESESEEEEEGEATDSDDESAAQREARLKREQAAKELQARRAKERAEAVAYDNARKARLAAERERRNSLNGQQQQPKQQPQPATRQGGMASRAIDPDDEDARDVIRNETDDAKLKHSGTKGTYSKAVTDRWGMNPAEHWAYSKSKTRTTLMMPKVCVYWRFIWAGERHEVELFHSTVSGKRTVKCDGAIIASEKLFIDTGSRHDFTVGTGRNPCPLTVLICSSGSDYAYELFINKKRFYQALQAWLIELQRDPSQAKNLEPLSPHAINTHGSSQPIRYR